MSEFNINESAEVFNEDEHKKQHVFVRVIKWIGIGIILVICLLLFYRCVTAINHPIIRKVLMNDAFLEAYENNPDSVKVRKYGMESAWESVEQGRLIEFNELYHIPVTNQLQFSIKYNHDIIDGEFEGIPFKLRLVDEEGKVFDEYWYETAKRERFRYIRVCFENIVLEKDGLDDNGKSLRHSYVVEIDAVQKDGSYKTICRYEVYDGDSGRADVFKNVPFEIKN